ncbi:nucleotidyltransferase family protein [Agathobacter sp.]|uniref:nucleotidyltransferase family protein n=1 Tax=Agathobacter sp. TaxID=2021311 RepID=UPI003FD8999E
MCTKRQLEKITDKMVSAYKEIYGDAIVKIFLYGSYARNEQTNQSDVDMVGIIRGNRVELQGKLRELWSVSADVGLENDVIVSPTIVPYDEFEKYRDTLPYYMNIEKEGVRVG